MDIDIVEHKGIKTVVLSGDIDMYTSHKLRNELMRIVQNKVQSLFVDFRNVSYMDSSGIATFVEVLKTMKLYGGRLKLISLPESVMEIFRFSKLHNVFEIYGNTHDAINS